MSVPRRGRLFCARTESSPPWDLLGRTSLDDWDFALAHAAGPFRARGAQGGMELVCALLVPSCTSAWRTRRLRGAGSSEEAAAGIEPLRGILLPPFAASARRVFIRSMLPRGPHDGVFLRRLALLGQVKVGLQGACFRANGGRGVRIP